MLSYHSQQQYVSDPLPAGFFFLITRSGNYPVLLFIPSSHCCNTLFLQRPIKVASLGGQKHCVASGAGQDKSHAPCMKQSVAQKVLSCH